MASSVSSVSRTVRGSGLVVVGGLDVVVILAIAFLVLVLRPRQWVAVERHELRVKGLTRTKAFQRSELSKVVKLDIRMSGGKRGAATPAWLVVDRSGAVVVKLSQRAWNIDELDAVQQELGLASEVIQGEQDAHAVNESFPGALSWWTLHPNKSAALLVTTIIGLALLINFAAR